MHLLVLMSRMWTATTVKTLANNSIFFLSFARSSHFDPKKTQGVVFVTYFHNMLEILTMQLTIGHSFELPSTNFVHQNIYMKTKRVPDPTFWAVGLCFWMVRWKIMHPIIPRHPSNGRSGPGKLISSNLSCQTVLLYKTLIAPRRQWV